MNSLYFDTRNFPEEDKLSAWIRGVPATFNLFFTNAESTSRFSGYWRADLFGPFIIRSIQCKQSGNLTQNWTLAANPKKTDTDTQQNYILIFVEKGEVEIRNAENGILSIAHKGDAIFSDAGQSYRGTATGDFDITLLSMPRHIMDKHLPSLASIHQEIIEAEHLLMPQIKNAIHFIQDNRESLTSDITKDLSLSLLHLLIACFNARTIGTSEQQTNKNVETPVLSDRGRVYSYIYQNLADQDLSPEKIASELGLSRANLYRLFSQKTGVAEFIREERLKNVNFMLRGSRFNDLSLFEIAAGTGFKTDRVMARAFRKKFEINPGQARLQAQAQMQAEATSNNTPINDEMQKTYHQWVNYVSKLQEIA